MYCGSAGAGAGAGAGATGWLGGLYVSGWEGAGATGDVSGAGSGAIVAASGAGSGCGCCAATGATADTVQASNTMLNRPSATLTRGSSSFYVANAT